MINKNKVVEILKTLLSDIEQEKSEAEVTNIIRNYLTEKGVTDGAEERIIRDICKEYLQSGGTGVLDDFETLITDKVTADDEAEEAIDEVFNS